MPTKSNTLIPYNLRDHNILGWKKIHLPLPNGDNSLLGSKITTFSSRYGMCLSGFLFLGELGTCPQNLMPTRGVEPAQTTQNCQNHHFWNIHFWKTLKSQFLVVFQSFIFGQILANFGSFCCIDSGWGHAQTWAKILNTS
jgi:hypothetical protein